MIETTHRVPGFFIVGAPKCGTTALAYFLSQHPDVYMLPKETHFFGSDLRFRRPRPTAERYQQMCAQAPKNAIIGDASVFYLYSEKAPREIQEWSPDSRVIIQLRNPVNMMHSLHQQCLSQVNEDIRDFGKALEAEEDRVLGRRIPYAAHSDHALFYRRLARFPEQIERYWNVFGKDRVKITLLEEMRQAPRKIYEETLEFLGLDPFDRVQFETVNPTTDVRFPILKMVQKKCLPMEGIVHRHAPGLLRLIMIALRWATEKPAVKRPMNPELRSSLASEFRPIVEKLGTMLNRDLGHWMLPAPVHSVPAPPNGRRFE
jgi:hypothetical protein